MSSYQTLDYTTVRIRPLKTAARLCGFACLLSEKRFAVKIVGLLPGPDVRHQLVQETNTYIQNFAGENYIGARKVHANHFYNQHNRRDLAHLNYDGRKRVLALILRILSTRL